jgi:hypothetical protein
VICVEFGFGVELGFAGDEMHVVVEPLHGCAEFCLCVAVIVV